MRMQTATGDTDELRRGFPVIAGGLVGMALQAAAYISLGTMMTPLMAAFGWSRTQIVVVALFSALTSVIVAPLVGRLLDRFGPRNVALWGFIGYPLALAAAAFTGPRIVSWWAAWILIAIVNFLVGPLVWTYAVTKSFTRRRGLAIGIVLCGMGVANAVIPLFLVAALREFGWRGAYVALAVLVLVVGGGVTFAVFRLPSEAPADSALPLLEARGMTAGQAIGTTRYWRLGIVIFLVSAAVGTLNLHLQPMLIDTGITMSEAAALAALFGPAQIAGRLLGGWLLDRISGPLLGMAVFTLPVIGCVVMLSGHGRGTAGIIPPLCIGLAAGVELDLATYMTSRYFGQRHFGTIFSGIFCFFILGYTGGPVAAAYVRDATSDYAPVLRAIVIALPVAVLLVGSLGRYPDEPAIPHTSANLASR
jgi:MFS family permease